MVETIPLTDAACKKLKPSTKLRWIKDAGGQSLYLVIAPRRTLSPVERSLGTRPRYPINCRGC